MDFSGLTYSNICHDNRVESQRAYDEQMEYHKNITVLHQLLRDERKITKRRSRKVVNRTHQTKCTFLTLLNILSCCVKFLMLN